MNIIEITQYSDEVLEALNDLLPQLSSSALPLSSDELTEIYNKFVKMSIIIVKDINNLDVFDSVLQGAVPDALGEG